MSPNQSGPVVFHTNAITEAPTISVGKSIQTNSSSIVHPTLHLPITQVIIILFKSID